uniref:Myb-like domain-containing protein n=1 Tax=Araucaria cunninghamii TaxID=56994 RepID=A0A0D6RAB1_ARACU
MKEKEDMQGRPQFGHLPPQQSQSDVPPQFLSSLTKQSASPHFQYENNNNDSENQSRDRNPPGSSGSDFPSELPPLVPSPISCRPPPPPVSSSNAGFNGFRTLQEEEINNSISKEVAEEDAAFVGLTEGGSRWPRQETLALLKIRSEMDAAFRDATLKAPLWEQVSRRLAELGHCRSAKKCKEKFENVTKYYKRTKDGRSGRQHGKTYRFFNQLEALYSNTNGNKNGNIITEGSSRTLQIGGVTNAVEEDAQDPVLQRPPAPDLSPISLSSEPSDDYDDDIDDNNNSNNNNSGRSGRKRKRMSVEKMMSFFEKIVEKVMEKQEMMQQRFLEMIEKREQDRMIREEAWKRQEMARLNRESELRSQERALTASRDTAIVAFLQKLTDQPLNLSPRTLPPQQIHQESNNKDEREPFDPNSKRWPKQEVHALIKLRSELEPKFQEAGPKAPLWEQISAEMDRLGYGRSTKRCKEKWENVNKYFRKTKESNKDRPENANTCPYFHQLDVLYSKGVLKYSSGERLVGRIRDHDQQEEELLEHTTCGSSRDDQSPRAVDNENSTTTAATGSVASLFSAEQQHQAPSNPTDNNNIYYNNPLPPVSEGLSGHNCHPDSTSVIMIQEQGGTISGQELQNVGDDEEKRKIQADLDLPYAAAAAAASNGATATDGSFMAMATDPPEFTAD